MIRVPAVQLTHYLRNIFTTEGILQQEIDALIDEFLHWKELPERLSETHNYYFSRDGFYRTPLVNGRKVLRHVHIPPSESEALALWDKAFDKEWSSRTSNAYLVYAQDRLYGYLWIAVIRDPPGAHAFSYKNKADLVQWANVADRFIFDGTFTL